MADLNKDYNSQLPLQPGVAGQPNPDYGMGEEEAQMTSRLPLSQELH